MSKTPSSFSGWPAWLLFLIAVLAVGPPSAAVVTSLPTITHNPLLAGGVLLAYEVVVGFLTIITAFVKKIWERRGDSWVDASVGQIEYLLRSLFVRYERRYAEFFYEMHRDLEMKGITIRGAYTLELEQVFVDVHLAPVPPERASTDPLRLPPALQAGDPTVWDYLRRLNRHLVILGPPGSGKTTLLKHLGLLLIRGHNSHLGDRQSFPWTTPVLLTLCDQKEAVSEHSDTYDILQAIGQQNIERVPSIRLSVVGDIFSGKSLYIAALLHQIKTEWMAASVTGFTHFTCLTPGVEEFYNENYFKPLFIDKLVITPTPLATETTAEPLIYEMTIALSSRHPPTSFHLMIYDASGEAFVNGDRLVRFARFALNATAFIFVVDPLTMLPIFRQLLPQLQAILSAQFYRAADTINSVMAMFERFHGYPASLPDIPIAVMLSKSDLLKYLNLPPSRFLMHPRYGGLVDLLDLDTVDQEIRSLLKTNQQDDLLVTASRFKRIKFFATSATGEPPNASGQFAGVNPCRCLDPVLWILYQLGVVKAIE